MNSELLSQSLAQLAEVARLAELLEADPDNDELQDELRALALSQEVRSDWRCFVATEECDPDEWRLVLCTGGPHVEVRGEFNNYGDPETASLWAADWGQSLAEVPIPQSSADLLLWFAQTFYWGN
jgi:hypothetical protein